MTPTDLHCSTLQCTLPEQTAVRAQGKDQEESYESPAGAGQGGRGGGVGIAVTILGRKHLHMLTPIQQSDGLNQRK